MKTRIVLAVVIFALVGASAAAWLLDGGAAEHELVLHGNVDLREVELPFKDSERILAVLVQEGDKVASGQVLARLDVGRLQPRIAQAEARVAAQTEVYRRMRNGTRPEEIAQARASVASARAEAANAASQYQRLQSISAASGQRAVSQLDLDAAQANLAVTQARLQSARKAHELAVAGPREEDLAREKAQLDAADAELALLRRQFADAELLAPMSAVVRSRLLEPGEIASPQRPVLTLVLTDLKWVRVYVPEPNLGQVKPGMRASISIDSLRDRSLGGWVGFISSVAADNPMCPATGHRICNDCMKACIYQKQDPVNVPQVETRCLTDVLALPWGVEIYDLLVRWNPLRTHQWLPKPYNGLKVMVCGMGPAGFTLAHHLLMEGFAVVGVDGLKIEPLPADIINEPVANYWQLEEELDERIMAGFGGVAESGITVRWDKNFLKLIYLTLARREHFQVFGGVRFGGTITVEDAWQLGFDHLVIAVGAGLPQALPVPGSLAVGMRQANDMLMALHLSGAIKSGSLANLQLRMPVVVIGGGLTGVDTAIEAQAYYVAQVEKILVRYEALSAVHGPAYVRHGLDEASNAILDEFLVHGRAVRAERERAERADELPNFVPLQQQWGGATIVYRRRMRDSPAYVGNHEELIKALEEGIYYAEALEPKATLLDGYGHVSGMTFSRQVRGADGRWSSSGEEATLPARSVLVATGARPNVAYEFEHRGTFQKQSAHYQPFRDRDGVLQAAELAQHCKQPDVGVFTSYGQDGRRVSYIGDTHPVFHGSVVGAIASGLRAYPSIVAHFGARAQQLGDATEYAQFRRTLSKLLEAHVATITRLTPQVVELNVCAPLAARRFRPGQLFRLQTFEVRARKIQGTLLHGEALALTAAGAEPQRGMLSFVVHETGVSSRLIKSLRPGDPITLMGPTGVKARITAGETILIITEGFGHAHALASGPALRAAGSRVLHVALFESAADIYLRDRFAAAADATLWVTAQGDALSCSRPEDRAFSGELIAALRWYAQQTPALALHAVQQLMIQAPSETVRMVQRERGGELAALLHESVSLTAAVNTPIQCGLKGVCAQCLHWQIDPATGERTKAIFGCSWQDQPLDIVDFDNVDARLGQNRLQEHLTSLWMEHLERAQSRADSWRTYLASLAQEPYLAEL